MGKRYYVYFELPKTLSPSEKTKFYKHLFGGLNKVKGYTVKRKPKFKTVKKEGMMLISIDQEELSSLKEKLESVRARFLVFELIEKRE